MDWIWTWASSVECWLWMKTSPPEERTCVCAPALTSSSIFNQLYWHALWLMTASDWVEGCPFSPMTFRLSAVIHGGDGCLSMAAAQLPRACSTPPRSASPSQFTARIGRLCDTTQSKSHLLSLYGMHFQYSVCKPWAGPMVQAMCLCVFLMYSTQQ